MKLRILTIIGLMLVIGLGAGGKGCGNKPVGSGGGSAGDWEYVRSVTSFWYNLPVNRPPLYEIGGIKVYSWKPPSFKTLSYIKAGVENQLARSSWNNPKFNPVDWWMTARNFDEPREYAFVVVEPTYRSKSRPGCGLIHVRAGEVVTAIETVAGVQIINGVPRAPGGFYIVLAGWYPDEPAESDCDGLRRDGADHGSEHGRTMDKPSLWFDLAANDAHPYFDRRPDGTLVAPDAPNIYKGDVMRAPVAPSQITLSDGELRELQKKYGGDLMGAWTDPVIQRQLPKQTDMGLAE